MNLKAPFPYTNATATKKPMKTVLAVKDLNVYQGTYAAVKNVSFALTAGTDTALIGPNGAGKSTLVKAILGILPCHSGSIALFDQPVDRSGHLPSRWRQQIAYLPQNFLFDRALPMTVAELVDLGWGRSGLRLPWQARRQRTKAVLQALEQVKAADLHNQPLKSLSGGELKRVLLAYCIVRPRRLLILDEAPAGLDFQSEAEFYQLLNQLKVEQGWAILQISHDLDVVSRHCDRVICLNRSITCQGTPDVVLSPENLGVAYGPELARYHHHH
jgi:zinc transport system ATP-binding protein